jgi:GAF domain-containing protein
MSTKLFAEIEHIFNHKNPPKKAFSKLMSALGSHLNCDRCFLYLRDPQTAFGRVEFCWIRNETIPKIYDEEWKKEPDLLANEDPMFAAALRAEGSIFVNDVKNTNSKVLNQSFEEKSFGHRALIHAHLCLSNQLWGVLQPCVFNNARNWDEKEKQVIHQVVDKITPLAVQYVRSIKQQQPHLFIQKSL